MTPGQQCHMCLKAEFSEEALGSLMQDEEERKNIKEKLNAIFAVGQEVSETNKMFSTN